MAPPTSGPRQTIGWPSGHEELDRDGLDAVALERRDLVVLAGLGLALQPEHHRDVRSGDVGVEQPDRCAGLGQRDREVDADRALADAALAGRDGEDVLDPGHQLLRLARLRPPDHRAPGDVHPGRPDGVQRGVGRPLDLVLERTGGRRELDRHREVGAVDHDVLDHVEGDEVAPELRLLDRAHRVDDGVVGEAGHRRSGPSRTWRERWVLTLVASISYSGVTAAAVGSAARRIFDGFHRRWCIDRCESRKNRPRRRLGSLP